MLTVLEFGDWVRMPPDGEVRKIVGFGPGEFVTTQLGDRHLPAVNTRGPRSHPPKACSFERRADCNGRSRLRP